MRRLVIGGAAFALGLVPAGAASANETSGTTNSVTIQRFADYNAAGFVLDVGLNVRCLGGVNGQVNVQVDQYPPETPSPMGFGSGPQAVVCDGKTHTVGVTIVGEGFDAGKAKATATLTVPLNGSAAAQRWITILVV